MKMSNMTPQGKVLFSLYDKLEAEEQKMLALESRLEHEFLWSWEKWMIRRRIKSCKQRLAFYDRCITKLRSEVGFD